MTPLHQRETDTALDITLAEGLGHGRTADTIDPDTARRLLLTADLMAIAVAVVATFALQRQLRPVPDEIVVGQLLLTAGSAPMWITAIVTMRLLDARATERITEELRRIASASLMIVASVVAIGFAAKFDALSRLWIALFFLTIASSLTIERRVARACFDRLRAGGRMQRRVVIIGDRAHAQALAESVRNHGGYELLGTLGDDPGDTLHEDADPSSTAPRLSGRIDEAERVLERTGATGVIVSLASMEFTTVNRLTRRLTDLGYHVALSSSLVDIDTTRLRAQQIDGSAMFYIEPTVRNGWRALAKRAFDIGVAGLTLLVSTPVLVIASVAIMATSRGPVVFRQTRIGKDGREFSIYKLRTMVRDAEQQRAVLDDHNEADGPLFKMSNDPRVTAVGRFLRRTSIDELPQCVNVLLGHMSVVGPRPALPSEVEQWDPEVRERLRVLPGITGLWQVSGRSDAGFDAYKRFDRYYVDNWSLAGDLNIVGRTFGVVIGARGAR